MTERKPIQIIGVTRNVAGALMSGVNKFKDEKILKKGATPINAAVETLKFFQKKVEFVDFFLEQLISCPLRSSSSKNDADRIE